MRLPSARSDHGSLILRWALVALALASGASAGCAKPSRPTDGSLLPPPSAPTAPVSPAAPVSSAAPVSPAAPDVEHGIVVDLLDDGSVSIDGAAVDHDAIRDALAMKPRSELAIFRGAKDAPWGRIVHLLDLMKQGGDRDFVLAVRDDRTRRTPPIALPKAGAGWAPRPIAPRPGEPLSDATVREATVRVIVMIAIDRDGKTRVDGAELTEPLRERIHSALARAGDDTPRVIIMADGAVALGLVIDATRAARAEGAAVAFGVTPLETSGGVAGGTTSGPRSSDTSRPRAKPKSFDGCPFPAAADKAGIDTTTATVRVKVDATGKPTEVLVVLDPGYGFGAAAKACASRASFEPAKDASGRAVAGEAVIRVRFVR